jgi:putative glutamine amidotransferase
MSLIAIAPAHHMDDYLASLREAGADELVLEYGHHDPADVVTRVNGVILLGGADVDPRWYGEAPHATYHEAGDDRDQYEIALARAAVRADVPLLAICRGLQVLNVALGGSLVQDIPSQVPDALDHGRRVPGLARDERAHPVAVEPSSLLARILGTAIDADGQCLVNSRHHQAMARVADGLVVTATSSDGVVEAAERPASRFCVGVQWHPENFWRTGEFQPIFTRFVEAARRSGA